MYFKTIILGAGAAGLMCASTTKGALVIDHAKAAGEKIRISGGGRCNFTNIYTDASNFISQNPHFAKSALSRYTQWDFLDLVQRHNIAYHEKTLGQMFCDTSAKDIIAMLHNECNRAGSQIWLQTAITSVDHRDGEFHLTLEHQGQTKQVRGTHLVVATGGKSIPKMGATGFAYDIAQKFGLAVTDTRPALVPFTFSDGRFRDISGVATPVRATATDTSFDEAMLFTHRGLSGPAMLQISSYWSEGHDITINLDPANTVKAALRIQRQTSGKRQFTTELAKHLPARLVDYLGQQFDLSGNLADWSDARMDQILDQLQHWSLRPTGTEGYRTAEVTAGGVCTSGLSSKTMAAKALPNLYFIGEAVDVTGWLGGYNFQWAWSSGVAAGRAIETAA